MKLSDFDVLSFDCYGTLIDWETGLYNALLPLLSRVRVGLEPTLSKARSSPPSSWPGSSGPPPQAPASTAGSDEPGQQDGGRHIGSSFPSAGMTRDQALQSFARHESAQQAKTPSLSYPEILAEVHRHLALEWGAVPDPAESATFGASVANWPPFPDTVDALAYLKQHFQLVILSNIDRASFQQTNQTLGVQFDAIYTAQDIGSYKPDPRNFAYMLDRLAGQGVPPHKILHVAQSLFHDHAPANQVGLASAWIDRRHDAPPGGGATAQAPADVRYDFRFTSLAALADAHQAG